MTCTSTYQPRFDAQNPAISGDRYGWNNCAAYVGAMGADYATCGAKQITGAQIRARTNEPIPDPKSPGLSVIQVQEALGDFGIGVSVFLRATWTNVENWIRDGRYVSLAVNYNVIRRTRFSGDPNFSGGHAIGVPPGWDAMDPLCDGRRAGIYKYHGEVYPRELLKKAAGAFGTMGYGYAQGWYTVAHSNAPTIPPPSTGGTDVAIATGGLSLSSKYVLPMVAGQTIYRNANLTEPMTKLSANAAPLFLGNPVGNASRAVQINTGAPYPDGVSRPTICYVPFSAGTPRLR